MVQNRLQVIGGLVEENLMARDARIESNSVPRRIADLDRGWQIKLSSEVLVCTLYVAST